MMRASYFLYILLRATDIKALNIRAPSAIIPILPGNGTPPSTIPSISTALDILPSAIPSSDTASGTPPSGIPPSDAPPSGVPTSAVSPNNISSGIPPSGAPHSAMSPSNTASGIPASSLPHSDTASGIPPGNTASSIPPSGIPPSGTSNGTSPPAATALIQLLSILPEPPEQDCPDSFINCEDEEATRESWINANVTMALRCVRNNWENVREDEGVQFDTEVARFFGYTQGPTDFQCHRVSTANCHPPDAVGLVCTEYFSPQVCAIPSTHEKAAGLLIMRAMANLSLQMAQAFQVMNDAIEQLHRVLDNDDFQNVFMPEISGVEATQRRNAVRAGLGGAVGIGGAAVAGIAGVAAAPVAAGVSGLVGAIVPAIIGAYNALQAGESDAANVGSILETAAGPMREAWGNLKRDLFTYGSFTPEGGEALNLIDDLIEPSEGSLAILEPRNEFESETSMPIRRIILAGFLIEGWKSHLHRYPFITFANDVGNDPCDGSGLHGDWLKFRHPSTGRTALSAEQWEEISVKMDNRCYYLLGAQVWSGDDESTLLEPDDGYRRVKRIYDQTTFYNPDPDGQMDVVAPPRDVCAWTTLPGATKSRLHGRDGMHDGLTLDSMIRGAVELWHSNGDENGMGLNEILNSDLEIPLDVGPAGSVIGIPVCDYISDEQNAGEGCPTVLDKSSITCGVFTEEELAG